jgi:predicted HicB family RNase H-like nuclease
MTKTAFTLRASKELLDRVRAKAAVEGRTLSSIVEEALRLAVARAPVRR